MPSRRILVIEDDPKTSASIAMYLRHDGYRVDLCPTGTEGLEMARRDHPDLVVLDLMLPGLSGTEICRTLRESASHVPIIMLTARSTEEDKLRGLGLGADDYVTKPFSPRELVARVGAVLRRTKPVVEDGDLVLDPETREVMLRGQRIALTSVEFRILDLFLRSPGRVFTREDLVPSEEALDRTVDAHIKNLRRKIEEDRAHPERIVTVFGVGYKYVPAAR
jgi:DNA-binding response OmpR family regulator